MFELIDRLRGVPAQIFDRVLVSEPVGALDGVVHVPFPVVRAHIAERRRDAACAATVCERVGNTLVTQATLSPARAQPTTARRPAPPAPTTTTSKS